MVLRAVVDGGEVLISALIRPEGPPSSVIEQVLACAFRLVCSEAIADDDKYIWADHEGRASFVYHDKLK